MGFIAWRLGGLYPSASSFQGTASDAVVVRKQSVYDCGMAAWDAGIRPGQAAREVRWRYPSAQVLAWRPDWYQATEEDLGNWLAGHAARFAMETVEGMGGWWEYPGLDAETWRDLWGEVQSHWARRCQAGVAGHPLLARWIREEGERWRLPQWRGDGYTVYYLPEEKEARFWPYLPLRYLNVPPALRERWWRYGWECVGQVPGLLERLRLLPTATVPPERLLLRETLACEGEVLGRLLEYLGGQLIKVLAERGVGVDWIRVEWRGEGGERWHKTRRWPEAVGERRRVLARLGSMLQVLPPWPPVEIAIEAEVHPLSTCQLGFWKEGDGGKRRISVGRGMVREAEERVGVGNPAWPQWRREAMWSFWDPWRRAGR